jgi:hypothetical protein
MEPVENKKRCRNESGSAGLAGMKLHCLQQGYRDQHLAHDCDREA